MCLLSWAFSGRNEIIATSTKDKRKYGREGQRGEEALSAPLLG